MFSKQWKLSMGTACSGECGTKVCGQHALESVGTGVPPVHRERQLALLLPPLPRERYYLSDSGWQ
jgi:hypothetical protein